MAKAEASIYDIGFSDGLKQVKKLYSKLDVSKVQPPEDDYGKDGPTEEPTETNNASIIEMTSDEAPSTREELVPTAEDTSSVVEDCIEVD